MIWLGYAGIAIPLWLGAVALGLAAGALLLLAVAVYRAGENGVDVNVNVSVGFEK